jgi:hypothetical protein
MESVAPVGHTHTGLQAEASKHDAVLGVEAVAGSGRIRYGIDDGTDVTVETVLIHIQGDSAAGTPPNIYASRLGAKTLLTSFLAVSGGLGGGASAGGPFFSPDLGLILGWQNPYVEPFTSVRWLASVPLDAQEVDTTVADSDIGTHVGRPQLTGGLGWTAGLRVALPPGTTPSDRPRAALVGAGGLTYLADADDDEVIGGWALGGELVF